MGDIGVKLAAEDFVHLHNHSHYSLLDGMQKIPEMLDRAGELGMQAIALTDHGSLSGAIEFYKGCLERKLEPIIGIETYVANRKHTDKDPTKDKSRYHLILLAMNNTGYHNLIKLSTIANLEGFYHKPRIDHDLLEKYNDGLIVLSGCIGGELGDHLRNGDTVAAKKIAMWYKNIFGDRYYIELQDHGHKWPEQAAINEQLLALAKELDIQCVITADAHYLTHEEQEAHEILLCVQTGSFLSDKDRMTLVETDLYLSSPVEIIERWGKEHPDLITNTRVIADRCSLQLELGKILIPNFSVPEGKTEKSYLHVLVYQGLAWRYGGVSEKTAKSMSVATAKPKIPREILERAEYELNTIDNMGFNGYFLIIWDFINWGKNNGIVFGPGRGSAAGSIVSYSLKITEIDPITYDLLFERFLNPDRISMPDIDIDIQDSRRDEVIEYVLEKYGKERVANIITFGTMAARNAVRDVARVLQVPYADADRLAKMIPPPIQGRHTPLKVSLNDNEDLKKEYSSSQVAARVFDLAIKLEGTIRSQGVHAAGVVIAPTDIVDYAPLRMAEKGVISTQYSMGPIEDIGLLKMDFLGLSNLTIIKNALRIIKKVYQKDIDINTIPLDDLKTFELLQAGDTTGVFQLESAGMKRYLKELKPTAFDDIIAMVALYRPGPMQWIEDFVARKHGSKKISYFHPAMEAALKSTYGIIVYQEQVMQISKDMCGFTGGQADTLRKAIGKKKADVMSKMKADFIDGAIKTVGAERSVMEEFWKQLEAFAAYAFPKAHASCYGLIAYQTAYLKANYPSAYMAALMSSDYDDTDRLAIEITECNRVGIHVLPPDVNESFHEFAVVPKKDDVKADIRFGLDAIKNVGRGPVEEIVNSRAADGQFASLEDFLKRISPSQVNRKAWESLIKAGAFDRFADRATLLASIDVILLTAAKIHKDKAAGQTDLFGDSNTDIQGVNLSLLPNVPPVPPHEKLIWERELLGLYLSDHPLSRYQLILSEKSVPISQIKVEHDQQSVVLGGSIQALKEITTKNGKTMAFVQLEDSFSNQIELVVFPTVYDKQSTLWQIDNVVLVEGRVNHKDKAGGVMAEPKILVSSAKKIEPSEAENYTSTGKTQSVGSSKKPKSVKDKKTPKKPTLYIRLADSAKGNKLVSLKQHLDLHVGDTEVILVLGPDSSKQVIKLPLKIDANETLARDLAAVVGSENLKFQ